MAGHVAHHFDDAQQQHEAVTLGMWLFLATEILFFGGMFTGYAVYRMSYPETFAEASRHLDLIAGTFNTVVLLASSLTVALAVHAAQVGRNRQLVVYLAGTVVLGVVFLGVKFYEYFHKIEEGLLPGPHFHFPVEPGSGLDPKAAELFLSFYFAMTGLHALHMIIGLVIFLALILFAVQRRFSRNYYTPVEVTGLYWHFVDIVWVFLFPLLYLI